MERFKTIATTVLAAGISIATANAQGVLIGNSNSAPHGSALLELDVSGMTEKKGILLPRITESEKFEIANPASSLLIYQTDGVTGFQYYDGSQWRGFGSDDLGNHSASENLEMQGNWLSGDGDDEGIVIADNGNVGVGVASPLAAFHTAGSVQMNTLSGSGTRMVVADADGNLSTQPVPTSGPGSGTTLSVHLTDDLEDLDVSGVSYIYFTTDGNHDIEGLTGGVQNQIIYVMNPEDDDDVKFKKNQGTQQFRKDVDVKKEEGAIILYTGSEWIAISKH